MCALDMNHVLAEMCSWRDAHRSWRYGAWGRIALEATSRTSRTLRLAASRAAESSDRGDPGLDGGLGVRNDSLSSDSRIAPMALT